MHWCLRLVSVAMLVAAITGRQFPLLDLFGLSRLEECQIGTAFVSH